MSATLETKKKYLLVVEKYGNHKFLWVEFGSGSWGDTWVCFGNCNGLSCMHAHHHLTDTKEKQSFEWYSNWKMLPLIYTIGWFTRSHTSPERAIMKCLINYRREQEAKLHNTNSTQALKEAAAEALKQLDTKIPELIKKAGYNV
jgi:hypothetical protein